MVATRLDRNDVAALLSPPRGGHRPPPRKGTLNVLKHLNVDEMVALIAPWVHDRARNAVFVSIPEIAALGPKIGALHGALLSARNAATTRSPELQAIVDQGERVDVVHDHLAWSMNLGLEAHAEYSLANDPPDADRAAQCKELMGKLFPSGMLVVKASFLAESGNTARVGQLLRDEPAIGAFLATIPVTATTSLLDSMNRWIAAGAELGRLERAREAREAKEVTTPAAKPPVTALRAHWLRLVSQVLSNLELSDASAEDIEMIRGPIERASSRAAARYAQKGSSDTSDTAEDAAKTEGAAPAQPAPVVGSTTTQAASTAATVARSDAAKTKA